MQLDDWEEYLSDHFEELHRSVGSDRALLCLEHGLDLPDIDMLKTDVRKSFVGGAETMRYPVTWSVYATEIGYLFSGGEYWITFENETPEWRIRGDRKDIRECFARFQKNYNGVIPTGPWAKHRSIICWPITHAILPNDLQWQLARILERVSYSIESNKLSSSNSFGAVISANSWDTTSRFKNFIEQPTLVGQIAKALLKDETSTGDKYILESTVERIRKDLDKASKARLWLNNAQRRINRRMQLKGFHHPDRRSSTSSGELSLPAVGSSISDQQSIKPTLEIYPAGNNLRKIRIIIPDFSNVLALNPDYVDSLTNSRVFVEGSSGRPLSAGALLCGSREVLLLRWPKTDASVLRFEKSTSSLDELLNSRCTISSGIQVFKIGSDGVATLILSHIIRPNSHYLILGNNSDPIDLPDAMPAQLDCDGAFMVELLTQDNFSSELISALERYGIQPARQIEIAPVGISPSRWDGEGSIEWLSTEEPTVTLYSSVPTRQYYFELLKDQAVLASLCIDNHDQNNRLHLKLPSMEAGSYKLFVRATNDNNNEDPNSGGLLLINIRNPADFYDSMSARGAMQVNFSPASFCLEDLLENEISLEVFGPRSRRICCTFELVEQNSHNILFRDNIKNVRIPFTSDYWSKIVKDRWINNKRCLYAYGASGEGIITFDGDDLGRYQLHCERQNHPLRWAFIKNSQGYEIRLIDDIDDMSITRLNYYSFENPCEGIEISDNDVYSGFMVQDEGLYVASSQDNKAAIIIPSEVNQFYQFGLTPHIERGSTSISSVLQVIELWSMARMPSNNLAAGLFRNYVLEALNHELFRLLGGDKWCRAERNRIDQGGDWWLSRLASLVPSYLYGKHWTDSVLTRLPDLAISTTNERVAYLSDLTNESLDLCEFALRLASAPSTARAFAGLKFEKLLMVLSKKTTISRIARFMCLVIRDYLDEKSTPGSSLYPSWKWN